MTIKRISSSNPYNQTISDLDLNDFILNGLIQQAKFNQYEIDAIYSDTGLSRKYYILSGAGHSLATYSNWTHLKAESGYSIWDIPFTDFRANIDSHNQLYFDDISLTYKGKADQESYTTFSIIKLYDGASYTDLTTLLSTEGGVSASLMASTSSYLYFGLISTFSAIDFDFAVKGSNYTLKLEYYDGDSWEQLLSTTDALVDNTGNFRSDGRIEFNIPSPWTMTTVEGNLRYFIRVSTTTTPVTVATGYSTFPGNSVDSLLQLSSTNVLNEEWSWCYFNNKVYVTIPNIGPSQYEGDTYVSSSSSTTNKQNYFIYNHEYKINYEKVSYNTGAFTVPLYGAQYYLPGMGVRYTNQNNYGLMRLSNTLSTGACIRIDAGSFDITTGASAGKDGAVPSKVAKYLAISVDGATYKIALFNA